MNPEISIFVLPCPGENWSIMKEALFGKTIDELIPLVREAGLPSFTGRQIAEWLYHHRIDSIDGMTNLSKAARKKLGEKYTVGKSSPVDVTESADGTRKYLFTAGDNNYIESVFIPEKNRNTLCLSCQAGCRMGCHFCMTGMQGFRGNLDAGEIINQVVSIPESDKLTNLVYMGMGEPFDNTENVIKSIEILTSDWGFSMSPRRITVSTIGIIRGMKEFLARTGAHLALSLHNPFPEERIELMPAVKTNSLDEVMRVINEFDWGRQRRISFEYIMLKDLNDNDRHINGLTKLLGGLRCRLNLIRFHSVPGMPFESSDSETIKRFRDRLNERGITATIRASRGEDILAACGMLSTTKQEAGGRGQGSER